MSNGLRNKFLLILGVVLGCIWFAWPIQERINLGLDLKGGMHFVLNVENAQLQGKDKDDAVLRTIEIIGNRINNFGVRETVVQRQGENQILVQLPGITDYKKAQEMLKTVAHLEFRLVNSDPDKLQQALNGHVPVGFELLKEKGSAESFLVEAKASMGGEGIADARMDFEQAGASPQISISFNDKGAREFGALTQKHVGERLAIIIDGEVLSAPNIREPILNGNAEITGQFTADEAGLLALALRSGSLPVSITVQEEHIIGPLLGLDSIHSGILAVAVAAAVVIGFMVAYYWLGGVIASVALLVNLIMILGAMGFINVMLPGSQVTLTLPGIAGIVLTLGMAVDANVLINERIREELEAGRPLASAIANGYHHALRAVIDTHVTSLVAAFLLFQFGSGPIKGFAVTLPIGLGASLFSAVYVSRAIFEYLVEKRWISTLKMLHLIKHTKIDFLKYRYVFLCISICITVAGIVTIVSKKDKVYGIDFVGGQVLEYRFDKPVSAEQVRKALKDANVKDAVIQQFARDTKDVLVRTRETESPDKIAALFKKDIRDNNFERTRIEKVGPVVGRMLREKAIGAILFALASILIYVGIRFKNFGFAAAGVLALLHDIVVALGISAMLGRQVDLLVVTALLTIAGYSINDTIIVFDRVRENMLKNMKLSLPEVINLSINQTLGRTVLTTFVTLLVVVVLFLLGGEVLNTFSLVMIIGFICGVYSTMFIVTPLILLFQKDWK